MKKLKPNIIFKGKDYLQKKVVGKGRYQKMGWQANFDRLLRRFIYNKYLKRIRDAT